MQSRVFYRLMALAFITLFTLPAAAKTVTLDFEEFATPTLIAADTYASQGMSFADTALIVSAGDGAQVAVSSGSNAAVNIARPSVILGSFAMDVSSMSVFAGTSLTTVQTISLILFDKDFNGLTSDSFTGGLAQTLSASASGTRFFAITSNMSSPGFSIDDLSFTFTEAAVVPLPATLPVLMLGLGGLAALRRGATRAL